MASELTPEEIRNVQFPATLRGLDRSEVMSFLGRVADEVSALIQQRDRMATRLGDYAGRDLESEFESVGKEVSAVLQAAREAADAMRERASIDASRWRSESMAEVERERKDAKNDAEALRGDAWTTGTELLTQTMNEIKRMREEAERDVLTIMGEAEREAHRLTSSARRDSEDLLRNATMDAEKTTVEASRRRDELIEQAHRQATSAEERTRALEERREELLEELEAVRSTLTRLEGSLEEKREDLHLSATQSTSVRVVQPMPQSDPRTWAPGETVRVIPKDREPVPPTKTEDEPVEVLAEPASVPEPAPEPEPVSPPVSDAPVSPPGDEAAPVGEPLEAGRGVPEPEPVSKPDEVGALFASLRGGGDLAVTSPPAAPKTGEASISPAVAGPGPATSGGDIADAIDERDARLLPVTNRALRGVKKAVTDAQNIALDTLRTDDAWIPDGAALAEAMRADLIGLWAEAFSAGHHAAEEMVGRRLKRPGTPPSDAADAFGAVLAESVSEALIDAGDGQRERQSATSRVFRAWRTDQAERRIRDLALSGYHQGIAGSVGSRSEVRWVPAGTPCSACREAAEDPRNSLPPVHAGCACTIVAV